MPSSSTRSKGAPHCLQMTAAQSPHTSGSVTARLHREQYHSDSVFASFSGILATLTIRARVRFRRPALFFLSLILISCGTQQNRTPALGEAYVGPATLNLHQDLNPKSSVTATVHHGEHLDIVEYKRRFIKVRTAGGIAGWTDIRQLLTPQQMTELQDMAKQSAQYPSQGTATTFESVNVHTEPNRLSPSFLQIPEGGKVEVIGHKLAPRTQAFSTPPPPPPRPRPTRRRNKEKASARIPPPPMPVPPRPPPNWQDLSKSHPAVAAAPKDPPKASAPVPEDDWSLIRAGDGKVGWVLTRAVTMAIPDEVAQYAEGHRITSYFPMGDVNDDGQIKHNWLWTTIRKGGVPYEFDNFRFFIWSKRHHRYETAYINRDVTGHYPVEVNTHGSEPTFTLLLEDDDGHLWRKKYAFNGYRVNLVQSDRYTTPKKESAPATATAENKASSTQPQSWYANVKRRIAQLFQR